MDHIHFMKQALKEAEKALHRDEFPVGCVMVYGEQTVASGSRFFTTGAERNELDHAEITALTRLIHERPTISRKDVVVFSTLEPCLMCYGALVVNGIRKIVYAYEDVFGGGTDLALTSLKPFYRNMRIDVVPGVLREESAALLKAYFSNPKNDYLKGTPLAEHALANS